MPEYLAPGVFVEEIESGSKPIEGVGINTAAFIGYAKSGEYNKPTFITNWTQFCQMFGEEENALMTALSKELKMSVSEVRSAHKASRRSWMEFAQALVLRGIREKALTTHAITSWQQFLRTYSISQSSQPYMQGSYLAHSVRGYYDNGGGRAYIVRIPHPDDVKALNFQVEGASKSGDNSVPAPHSHTPPRHARITAGPLLITAAKTGPSGNDIKVEVEHVGDGNEFRLKVQQGNVTEIFPEGKEGGKDGKDRTATLESIQQLVNDKSKLIGVQVQAQGAPVATLARPEARAFQLEGGLDAANLPAPTTGLTQALVPSIAASGEELMQIEADDFVGQEENRTGISGLLTLEDVNMVCVPDLMAGLFQRQKMPFADMFPDDRDRNRKTVGQETLVLNDERRQAILDAQCALVAHCERAGDRMAVLDPVPGLTPQEMRDLTLDTPYNCDHGQAAIYYPWIKIADPINKGQQMFVPPSGHIAGVWARVGVERGVHKAPANEALIGAVAMERDITKGEQEILNPEGINCIRSFAGQGIRVWGARTLATVGNPSWKYVNVRRLFNYLEKSMERSLQWVVFEPNDDDLWGRVRRNVSAFLFTEWKEGKLFGTSPQEAFVVKCDSETNPQEMIDLGRLYVEVGINPVKPAEFVIMRIGQYNGGTEREYLS